MIGPFTRQHFFLSNFYPAEVTLGGIVFPTVEHAYQAAKTNNLKDRLMIRDAPTPGKAKRLGKTVLAREDWGAVRLDVMRALITQKFTTHLELRKQLLDTGNHELVEVNTWGDRYWGRCNGKGENHLGRILMDIRDTQ